jgi:hypothetical protein
MFRRLLTDRRAHGRGGRASFPQRNAHVDPGVGLARESKKVKTMQDPPAAAAIIIAFLLSNGAVQGHWPEFGGGICGKTVLEAGA